MYMMYTYNINTKLHHNGENSILFVGLTANEDLQSLSQEVVKNTNRQYKLKLILYVVY